MKIQVVEREFVYHGAVLADPASGDVAPQGATLVQHAAANVTDLLWNGALLPNSPIISPQLTRRRPSVTFYANARNNAPLP